MSKVWKPILCVDFDGVVHSYTSGWKGAAVIPDPPVKGALQWIWEATDWFEVHIYSSRSKYEDGRVAMHFWFCSHSAEEFGLDHPMAGRKQGPYPLTFSHEKPAAFLTIDDRAICFNGDWASLDPEKLREFKPWNKL